MAIFPVTSDDVEIFTTVINPTCTYISSSLGVTGSIRLFPRSSKIEKEVRPLSNFSASYSNDSDIENFRRDVVASAATAIATNTGNFEISLINYLTKVNTQPRSAKKQKLINVIRFTPSVSFTSNTLRKLNVKDVLMKYYRSEYQTANWAYTNYHSLNFFTSPTVPTSSVLLYPNISGGPSHAGHVSGTYCLSGAMSFDFYINPRQKFLGDFKAGTIFHLSSSYALSLVSGSQKDENGKPSAFRLLLQLSHSADIPPSKAVQGTYPNNLVFLSEDNSLNWNEWSRVVVRWGTNLINDGTGSFNINGIDRGFFVVPSGTISPKTFTSLTEGPRALCVGNYYEGTNQSTDSQAFFFSEITSARDGVSRLVDSGGSQDQPSYYSFAHPLNAELHDLVIHRNYLNDVQISQTAGKGIKRSELNSEDTAFYLPPFFVTNTNIRKYTSGPSGGGEPYGGILQTPFYEIDGSTDDPFNVAMSFGVNGHYINLENFVKDFANNNFPRLHHMSGTAIGYTTDAKPANEFLYQDPFVRKRNLLVMPCDDGNFSPNFSILSDQNTNKYTDIFGRNDLSLISLEYLLNSGSIIFGEIDHDPSFLDQQIGFSPENPGSPPGPAVTNVANEISSTISLSSSSYSPGVQKDVPLTIFQRTKDQSSNQVTFFDISNLFYGSRILPGSFQIIDSNLTGSGGRVSITLKDDGYGNIYRADSNSKNCTWNSVGNIFYNEGIVLIKSPHLYFFGKEKYEMSFRGEHLMHTSKYEVLAPSGLLNSSSNPTFALHSSSLKPSGDPLDNVPFVYISNINFHDENLNVVAKASLAQPIMKREGEKILFKVTFDW